MNGVSTFIKNWGNKGIDFFKKKFRPNLVNLDVDWANTKWSGLAGPLTGIIGGGVGDFIGMDDKQDSLSSSINSYGQDAFGNITDNSSLIMAGTMPNMSAITDKDIRDKTWGEDIGSAVTNGIGAGFSTGNWLLGAGVAAFDLGKSLVERVQAGSLANTLEEQRRNKERGLGRQLYTAALGVDERNDFNRLMSYYDFPYDYAFGGLLHSHGGDYNGGLTYINEGGRHEENPYEGVPSGFDEDGNPNLVEEGEVIWNNEYVFSDRLKVPEELAKKYKLGGKKDYTFAEAIEKVTKENRISPTDAITIATTKEIVNEFMQAQEALREQEQIAAREELEAAQAQDFLAQLDAAQGGGYPMGAPVDMGQASMGMPNEAPVTEGEMMPPGFAFGGNKFVGGGDKDGNLFSLWTDKKTGQTYYILPNGEPYDSLQKAQARVAQLGEKIWDTPSYNSSIDASVVAASRKNAEKAAQSTVDVNKIYKKQIGYNTKGQPTYQYTVIDPNNGKKYTYLDYQSAAQKYSSIPRKVNDPRVKGGYAYVTPYGDIHMYSKEAKKSLDERFTPSSATSTTASLSTTKGLGTTAGATGTANAADSLSGTMVPMAATSTTVPSGTTGTGTTTSTTRTTGSTGTTSTAKRSAGTGTRSSSGAPAPTGGTMPEINSWESLYSALEGYNGSLGESAADGKYAVDRNATYWKNRTAKDIEGDEAYGKFSDWIKEHSDNPNVRKYFEYLDKRINKSKGAKTLLKYDKDGKVIGLADDWKTTFDERRNDGDLGAYHINPSNLDFLSSEAPNAGTSESTEPFSDIKSTVGKAVVGLIKDGVLTAPTIPSGKTTETGTATQTTNTTPPPAEPQFNYRDTYLRYAPAIGSSMAALYGMLNRPDYSNADRVIDAAYRMGTPVNIPVETIGDYRRRNPYDERYLVNMANQNRLAAARGIANTAGGNRAMDLLGNMSLAHNNQQELGEIMRQAYLANRQDDAQVSEFNRGTNVYNMNALNQRNLSQAQLNSHRQQASMSGLAQGYGMRQAIKDNWDASTMQSLNSTLASLGAIGKENEEYNMLMSMAENGYFPYYYGDRSIIKFNPYTGEKLVKNGGKLNRKKRRF